MRSPQGGPQKCRVEAGGGRGGCMIALVDDDTQAAVQAALTAAGARAVLVSEVGR